MLQIIPKTNIDFIGRRYVFFAISGALILASIGSLLIKKGPRWGLDFTGGTLVEVQFAKDVAMEDIRKSLTAKLDTFELQSTSGKNLYIIRTRLATKASKPVETTAEHKDDVGSVIQSTLDETFADNKPVILRKEFVGPTVGSHLIRQTFMAFALTFVGIIIYVAFRFHSGIWGASGVLALIHDVFITVGIFSMLNKEITVTIVAALLTIAGYSINDTIVIFDFMRDRLRLRRTEPLADLINKSLNDTLSRTIITNFTIFLVVSVLFFFGGEVIHDFAFAMVIGAIVGTYSSLGIAAPAIYEYERIQTEKASAAKRK